MRILHRLSLKTSLVTQDVWPCQRIPFQLLKRARMNFSESVVCKLHQDVCVCVCVCVCNYKQQLSMDLFLQGK